MPDDVAVAQLWRKPLGLNTTHFSWEKLWHCNFSDLCSYGREGIIERCKWSVSQWISSWKTCHFRPHQHCDLNEVIHFSNFSSLFLMDGASYLFSRVGTIYIQGKKILWGNEAQFSFLCFKEDMLRFLVSLFFIMEPSTTNSGDKMASGFIRIETIFPV